MSKARYGILASDASNESQSVNPMTAMYSEHGNGGVQLTEINIEEPKPESAASIPSPTPANQIPTDIETGTPPKDGFYIRLFHKETVLEIRSPSMTEASSVLELKKAIDKQCTIPPNRQRLIFSGRLLSPDDKPLQFFKLSSGNTVHMFPVPVPSPTPDVHGAAAGESGAEPRAIPVVDFSFGLNPVTVRRVAATTMPVYYDPSVNQSSREVRIWCFVLVFLSAMTLINYMSLLISPQGLSGTTVFDRVIMTFEVVCSVGGLYVGSQGLESTRSFEIGQLRTYVVNLCRLAVACAVLRIMWVINLSIDVQVAVDKNNKAAHEAENTPNTDPNNPQPHVIDQKVVGTFEIQAVLICLVCLFAWLNCVVRAIRLRNAVQTYNDAHV